MFILGSKVTVTVSLHNPMFPWKVPQNEVIMRKFKLLSAHPITAWLLFFFWDKQTGNGLVMKMPFRPWIVESPVNRPSFLRAVLEFVMVNFVQAIVFRCLARHQTKCFCEDVFLGVHACVLSHFSCVRLCETPWTVAHQAPLSMGFSRQEYCSGLPCPPPGDLFLGVINIEPLDFE